MIRIFTNYSYGGYEERYLGNLDEKDEFKYFLPLLPVKMAKLERDPGNTQLAEEVRRLSGYPKILDHGENEEATLPAGTFTIISNPGYYAMYRKLGGDYVLAIGKIPGPSKNGETRENPFTMVFAGEMEDVQILDALSFQMLYHREETKLFLADLFDYDPAANGLRFNLKAVVEKLNQLAKDPVIGIKHNADVPFLILDEGYELKYVSEIHQLKKLSLGSVYDNDQRLLKGSQVMMGKPLQQQFAFEKQEEQPATVLEPDTSRPDARQTEASQNPAENDHLSQERLREELKEEIRKEMEPKMRADIEKDLRPKIEREIRAELERQTTDLPVQEQDGNPLFRIIPREYAIAAISAIAAFILGALCFGSKH